MKKFELHLDALVVMIVVFAIAMAFLLYQRHQYSVVMQENIDLLWENSSLEANLVLKTSQFDKCRTLIISMKESSAVGEGGAIPE